MAPFERRKKWKQFAQLLSKENVKSYHHYREKKGREKYPHHDRFPHFLSSAPIQLKVGAMLSLSSLEGLTAHLFLFNTRKLYLALLSNLLEILLSIPFGIDECVIISLYESYGKEKKCFGVSMNLHGDSDTHREKVFNFFSSVERTREREVRVSVSSCILCTHE